MRRYFFGFAIAIAVAGLLLTAGCKSTPETSSSENKPESSPAQAKTPPATPEETGTPKEAATSTAPNKEETTSTPNERVVIETDKGKMVLELYPDVAPKTVDNFKKLVAKGFYNGLTFHRVVPKFVIQGGDPNGNGSGGPGYNIKDEFNSKKHIRGTLAMAKTSAPDSAGSQFYICIEPQPSLDGNYTVFGQTVEGLDVIDKIAVGDKMNRVYLEPTAP